MIDKKVQEWQNLGKGENIFSETQAKEKCFNLQHKKEMSCRETNHPCLRAMGNVSKLKTKQYKTKQKTQNTLSSMIS